MRNEWIAFLMIAAFGAVAPIAQEGEHYVSPWRTPWTYEEADHWSQLDPLYALCNTGKEQSPIDLRNTQKAQLPALRFEFKSAPLKFVINNGHTIRVNYQEPPGSGDLLIVGDKRYQLTQFHFHRPSEEYIDGKPYDMEVHLMFQAGTGEAAGVTVFLKRGDANRTVQKLWKHMPGVEGQEAVTGVDINPADLLPHNLRYYMYMGSQTAPPCAQDVTWFVLKTPVEVSAQQIDGFAKLYPHDVRPLQPLNGRVVSESQ